MKSKLLFLSLFTFITISVSAQDTSHAVIPDTSKVTFSTVYSDVKEGLKGLGSALKVGSEHVYTVLVKQQIVYAISYLILLLVSFICIFPIIKYVKFLCAVNDADDYMGAIILCGACCIAWLILTTIALVHMKEIITGFINPEYGALKDILYFIHPGKGCN